MLSVKKIKDRGFTVVELLIVIVVIGILATLVVTTYTGIHEKDRDTKRKDDINQLQAQVEAYEAQNGNYPTLANINNPTWRSANMKNLDSSVMKDPKGSSETLVSVPAAKVFAYSVTPNGCDDSTVDCTGYTLTATLEAGGTYTKENLN